MKKIPKSITVTVRREDRHLFAGGSTYTARGVGKVVMVPRCDYRVTYTVCSKGGLRVYQPGFVTRIYIVGTRGKRYYHACFLGNDWHGLRVSRTVEKVEK